MILRPCESQTEQSLAYWTVMYTDHLSEYECVLQYFLGWLWRSPRRCWYCLVVVCTGIGSTICCSGVRADFDTIINSPPTEFSSTYGRIESNTQLNLYPGGILPNSYTIGPSRQPGDNIEINLVGGTIGTEDHPYGSLRSSSWVRTTNVAINLVEGTVWGNIEGSSGALVTMSGAAMNGRLSVIDGSLAVVTGGEILKGLSASSGSMVQMSGGNVGSYPWSFFDGLGAYSGSVFLMTGGVVVGGFVVDDSYASLAGGRIEGELHVSATGQLEITGGSMGPIHLTDGGIAILAGGEFQLNGEPLEGLTASAQSIDFPPDSVLTGVLSDGTPLTLSSSGYLHDYFEDNRITLRLSPVPASEPRSLRCSR